MSTVSHDVLIKLRNLFASRFTSEELDSLAFALEIDFDDIPGSTKSAKARELAGYLNRRGLMDKLQAVGPVERPDINWDEIFGEVKPVDPVLNTAHNPVITQPRDLQTLASILAAYHLFETPAGVKTVLGISGVGPYVNLNINGPAQVVASDLLVQANDFGEISPGDTAIGRLLAYISLDSALPPAHKETIAAIAVKYGIPLN